MMKNMIMLEKTGKKKEQLVLKNVIKLAEGVKMLTLINLYSKYMWAISNTNMDIARDLRLTSIKK